MILRGRKYKSGSRWALWRWTETPSGYITRLHLLMTPFFAICLHWISTPDKEPWLHDHPVSFLSIILRGWYVEKRTEAVCGFRSTPRLRVRKWWNFIRASDLDTHTIVLTQKRTLTLCFMGPKRRVWGFHTDDGWVDWKTYNDEKYTPATVKTLRKVYKTYYNDDYVKRLAEMPSLADGFFNITRKDFHQKIRVQPVVFDTEPLPAVYSDKYAFDYEAYELSDET